MTTLILIEKILASNVVKPEKVQLHTTFTLKNVGYQFR